VTVRVPAAETPPPLAVTENGQPAAHVSVPDAGAPAAIALAIDTSGSMAGTPIQAANAAAQRLLQAVGANGKVALVTFNDHAALVQPLTSDASVVRSALGSLTLGSGTSLYDGIAGAVRAAGDDPGARRVVVVLSDGADTNSATSLEAARALAERAGVEIDAVGLTSSKAFTPSPLEELASATGGGVVLTRTAAGLEGTTLELAQAKLARSYAVDVELPETSARNLALSVRGAPAATLALPAEASGRADTPWMRYGGLLAGLLAFAAVFTLLISRGRASASVGLATRLKPYSAEVARDPRKSGRSTRLAEQYSWMEDRFGGTRLWQRADDLCSRAGVRSSPAQLITLSAALALIGLAAAYLVAGPIAAPLATAVGILPTLVLRFKRERRQKAFEDQLPELLGVMASALRAGRSFAHALDSLVEEADEPAHSEFRRAQQDVRLGVPIERALDQMARRLHSESFELVVLTTDVQRRVGGNVAEVFDQVAETIRKRQQFAGRVKALTAMGRMSAYVLLGLPFVLAGVLTIMSHSYMTPLFTTSIGHLMIGAALVMMAIGSVVLRAMVKPRATS
jgi:tight adherence protein B